MLYWRLTTGIMLQSGTVGNPKGVMLSHDNLVQDAQVIKKFLKLGNSDHVLIGYLPLSHVAAQVSIGVLRLYVD